jgi:hypothetical protein
MTTWDVLIPTIPHRDASLRRLLAELDCQWRPGLGVILSRDNLERPGIASYAKWRELVEASRAEYVCIMGDDDTVAPDYVARIMEALERKPDYVGFPVSYSVDGVPQQRVEHSLRHPCWIDSPQIMMRDIVHSNPIRRELALLVPWQAVLPGEDLAWADRMRATGRVKSEVWIDEPMYHYQPSAQDFFWTPRKPMAPEDIPELPSYPWLTALEGR